jgi:magnesium chelatase accessory protein
MSSVLDWARDGPSWPHREFSRHVRSGTLRWHVQIMGKGPVLLLLHGTGASSHSWRDVAQHLAAAHTVVIPDLPGHGFTGLPALSQLSLPSVASAIAELLRSLKLEPERSAGHSAGAAILARMSLDGLIAPESLVSFNGAYFPLGGPAAPIFSPLAKLLVWNPFAPRIFAHMADTRSVKRLLDDTGSKLEPEGIELYRRLFASHPHVSGALGMMAAWDLQSLQKDLPRLKTPLTLVKALRDRSIAPETADRVSKLVPGSSMIALANLGHLAHEEEPELAARIIAAPENHAGQQLSPAQVETALP